MGSLKIHRTTIVEGGMKPLTIIEYHHVVEHDQSCRLTCGEVMELGTLGVHCRADRAATACSGSGLVSMTVHNTGKWQHSRCCARE